VNKEDARKLVDAMERLEDMGFSAEYMIEKNRKPVSGIWGGFCGSCG